ncbi:MAG TPA: MFS transporter [Ktedonobacteraceae bacterium]|nr:MFS transporter [Ktedonobacteraceae bacterium]
MQVKDVEKEKRLQSAAARLWHNRDFNIFWLGQTLSVLGDAFATIAIPLLVLQATGSVAQMGLVTGTFGVGQLVAGIFAGAIVDRLDRRRLMIFCDTARVLLYLSIPLGWLWLGPQLWVIYVVVALGSCLGMVFQVAYVAAIPNMVERVQISDANGRLQASYSLSFVLGPILAGLISARFGSTFAISIDSLSFGISALSLLLIRFKHIPARISDVESLQEEIPVQVAAPQVPGKHNGIMGELLAGLVFLWQQPILRTLSILLLLFTLFTAGALDLFIFHLKHDLGQNDSAVGVIFGLASLGSLLAGIFFPLIRNRLGFGICWIGGFFLSFIALLLIGLSQQPIVIALLAILFTFSSVLAGMSSMSLRQQITPDHLLGRVTSAFWTIGSAPGPLGAALFTALTVKIGTPNVLLIIGSVGAVISLTAILTPIRQRYPEKAALDLNP